MAWHGRQQLAQRGAYEEQRKRVLVEANHQCQIGLPGVCTGKATTVDHIRSLAEGGSMVARDNLRAACRPCNERLGAQLGGRRLNVRNQRWSRAW